MKPERGNCLKVQLSRNYIYGIFILQFFKQTETRAHKTNLNYVIRKCYRYIISTSSLQEFAQETLPLFQGHFY